MAAGSLTHPADNPKGADQAKPENAAISKGRMVGGTGIEPVTPTMSTDEASAFLAVLLGFPDC